MRILCVSIDLPGHLDWGGYLSTAAALAGRGHDVCWASGRKVEPAIRAAGIAFKALSTSGWLHEMPPLDPGLDPQERQVQRAARGLRVWLSPGPILQALAELERSAADFKPDLILTEPYAAAGTLLAEKLDVDLAVVGRPALPDAQVSSPAAGAVRDLLEAAGAAGRFWDVERATPRSPKLHLDFFCRSWYEDLPEIAPQTVFCGGPAPVASPTAVPSARPLVLVTLGSTFADDEVFFRLAAEGAHMAGAQSLLVTGRTAPNLYKSLREAPPGRAQVRDWVEYGAVFPQVAAIVHHGGIATTQAALLHGIPQVVVPHAGDQWPQAARVTQARVGYGIRAKDFNTHSAPLILADALYDAEFRASAADLAAEMQALGGVERAVEAVLGFSGRG